MSGYNDLIPFDVTKYLATDEARAEYLNAHLEANDDAATVLRALGNIARAKGMTAVAEASGLPREGIYRSLGPDGNPHFATVVKLMHGLGLRLKVVPKEPVPARKGTRGRGTMLTGKPLSVGLPTEPTSERVIEAAPSTPSRRRRAAA
jgi:probable addiction module antidote protein